MAKRLVTNIKKSVAGVDLMLKRVEDGFVGRYRDVVWLTFCRILENTPQFSGRAVANWQIGVGAPDKTFDPSLGEPELALLHSHGDSRGAHHKGDKQWIEEAKRRNAPKIPTITRRTKVYFTNMTKGDNDHRRSSVYYLESLQDPEYWMVKLRNWNKPYETAAESLVISMMEHRMLKTKEGIVGGDGWRAYVSDTL